MALISCPECKKKFSDTAAACPNCGYTLTPEKIADIRKKEQQAQKVGAIGCLSAVAILVSLYLVGSFSSDSDSGRGTSKTAVAYSVVEEWSITNGGYGRVIVVDPSLRSEAGLLALADQLRRDTRADRNAFVFIYDDRDAAKLRKAALEEQLSDRVMKFHDDHFIGTYFRNANTGFHALTIMLQGVYGPTKRISLR